MWARHPFAPHSIALSRPGDPPRPAEARAHPSTWRFQKVPTEVLSADCLIAVEGAVGAFYAKRDEVMPIGVVMLLVFTFHGRCLPVIFVLKPARSAFAMARGVERRSPMPFRAETVRREAGA